MDFYDNKNYYKMSKKVLIILGIVAIFSLCGPHEIQAQSQEINHSMNHYDQLVLKGSYDSIAGMFTANAELKGENQTPIDGREQIRKLLRSFKGAHVLKYETSPLSTLFGGDSAIQSGSYIQVVRIENGDTLELAGQYEATWIKENGKDWMIKKMYTHHYRNLKEENYINTLPDNSIAKQFGKTLLKKGSKQASTVLTQLIKDTAKNYVKEAEFNRIGYSILNMGKEEEALRIFEVNTQLFPASWNAFDSYGEALLKYGYKEQAIKMYQKSVELNPNNENGKKVLQHLR